MLSRDSLMFQLENCLVAGEGESSMGDLWAVPFPGWKCRGAGQAHLRAGRGGHRVTFLEWPWEAAVWET